MPKLTLAREAITVPLDKLTIDPANVRKTGGDVDVAALAENIAHEGLLQNLGVRPVLSAESEPTGRYLVCIGGRRLAALKLLAKQKRLAKAEPVACQVIESEAGTSAGLAENLHRVAMHPADAYAAFASLSDQGKTDDDIAIRFGISTLTVQRRMRLGRLSPVILDALRAGQITEAMAQAYAITTDHAAQERVFEQFGPGNCGWVDPRTIRKSLTEGEVARTDRRVSFVGLPAYEQAGGAVRRDLFSDETAGITLIDAGLLDRLVIEKLAAEADRLRADGWKDVTVSVTTPENLRAFYTAPCERVGLSEDDDAQLTTLAKEYDVLAERSEQDGLSDDEEGRAEAIQAEIAAIQGKSDSYSDETKAGGKVFVYLEYNGPQMFYGLPRAGLTESGNGPQAPDDYDDSGAEPGCAKQANRQNRPELSGSLTADLLAQRTAGLQAQVADKPGLALRLVVHSLLLASLHDQRSIVAQITPHQPFLKQACPTIEDTPAHRILTKLHDDQHQHIPGAHSDILPWLLEQSDATVLDMLAPLVALTVDAGTVDWSHGPGVCFAARAAQAAELDMAEYWVATPETYFKRVSKAQIAQAVNEAGAGPFSADGKKADIAAAAARVTTGTGWLPALLRMPPSDDGEGEQMQVEAG